MMKTVLPALAIIAASAGGLAEAQTIERIKENQEIRLGYRTDARPLSYQTDQGNPAGYSPVLCSQVAQGIVNTLQVEAVDVEFVPVSAQNRFDMVASGEVDLLCGAASVTLSRREVVDFSIPVFVDGMAVMLPTGAENTLSALAGQRLGVRSGTTTQDALNTLLEANGVEAEIVAFDDHGVGMAAMGEGDLAAYFADQSILLFLNADLNAVEDFQVMNRLLTIETQALALQRGDTEFRLLVDSVLSNLFDSGLTEQIFRDTLPNAVPGQAMQALFIISPIRP